MKVLFLLPYPIGRAPSQRFRVEKLLKLLDEVGVEYALRPFMNEATSKILYKKGSILQKVVGITKGYLSRAYTVLFEAAQYDRVFIHREAAPLGPPIFEWYLAKILNKPIIYDFDDAIWIPNTSAQNNVIMSLKAFWKIAFICKWASSIAAGNNYLGQFARNSSLAKVFIIPTVVDTIHQYNLVRKHTADKVVVGWTGSHSTIKYLDLIVPVLKKLQERYDFTFLVIADKKPELALNDFTYKSWNAETEIDDLIKMDIGIMPLIDDLWAEGKCGFKLIQYLSLGIPAIAHPVGVNKQIIEHGVNGFLCTTPEEWHESLKLLIEDASLRKSFGEKGRQKIINEYSIEAHKEKFLDLFH